MPALFPRCRVIALTLLALGACASVERAFAPSAEPWPRWQESVADSILVVDHSPWDRFLAAYLSLDDDGVNRLAYGRVSQADRLALAQYVDRLAATAVSALRRDEQFALWVNLYNALTVKLVLDHYPVASIRDIALSPGLLSIGPWGAKLIAVEGEALSLDDIEHRILRPIWHDPRIHYAVNCAAAGCPNLQPRAFRSATQEAMLEAAARAFVNHRRGARIEEGRLRVSRIYFWFAADFGGDDAGILAHLRRYADPALAAALSETAHVADGGYDWSLNERR